jgi:hypothetical protein
MKLLWDDGCLQWVKQFWSQSFVDARASLLPSNQIIWLSLEQIRSLTSVHALKEFFTSVSFSSLVSILKCERQRILRFRSAFVLIGAVNLMLGLL